jgi:perosamine synthetase
VFADIDAETFTLDPDDVARRLTPRTRAILAVHYGGQPADLGPLAAIAEDAGVVLLEDAAEAHGATYRDRPVGAIGRAGMFSFTPTKNITTGEGGLVVTSDAAMAERMRLLRNHGQTGVYEHTSVGYNWRLSDLQAAIGRVQLGRLDEIIERKRSLAVRLGAALAPLDGIHPPVERSDRSHVYMLYTTVVEDGRDELASRLHAAGIEARLYFPPAHTQPIFADEGVDLPVTEWAGEHLLSLPLHARLSDASIEEIATAVGRG